MLLSEIMVQTFKECKKFGWGIEPSCKFGSAFGGKVDKIVHRTLQVGQDVLPKLLSVRSLKLSLPDHCLQAFLNAFC